MANLADFERIISILQAGARSSRLDKAQQDFLAELSKIIGIIEADKNQNTNFSGLVRYISENQDLDIFKNIKDRYGIDLIGELRKLAEELIPTPFVEIEMPKDGSTFNLNLKILFKARIVNLELSEVKDYLYIWMKKKSGEARKEELKTENTNKNEIISNNGIFYTVSAMELGLGEHSIDFSLHVFAPNIRGHTIIGHSILERSLSSKPITVHIVPESPQTAGEKRRIPTQEELAQIIKRDYGIDKLPEREPVDDLFRGLFFNLSNTLNLSKNLLSERVAALLESAVQNRIIDSRQRDFLMELVAQIENDSLDNALQKLGLEGADYFDGDAHIEIVANTFLRLLLNNHPITPEVQEGLDAIKKKLEELADEISALLYTIEQLQDNINLRIASFYNDFDSAIKEIEDYKSWHTGSLIKLYISIPDRSGAFTTIDSRNSAIMDAIRKIQDTVNFFTSQGSKSIDRFITKNIVTIVDICDDYNNSAIKEFSQRFMQKSGIEDISPKIGDIFNAINQHIIGFREDFPRHQVMQVSKRGLMYKGRTIRQSFVIVGR